MSAPTDSAISGTFGLLSSLTALAGGARSAEECVEAALERIRAVAGSGA